MANCNVDDRPNDNTFKLGERVKFRDGDARVYKVIARGKGKVALSLDYLPKVEIEAWTLEKALIRAI